MSQDPSTRRRIAEKIRKAADQSAPLKAFVGLDGFVDEIIHVVDQRSEVDRFQRIPTIEAFSARIAEASGRSTNMELVTQHIKLGGNGPIMANALASAGVEVNYLGTLGYPEPHPVFKPLLDRAKNVYSVAEPGHTDAYEFQDGKLMMGKLTPLNDICWQKISERMGAPKIAALMASSDLVAFVNWTMLPFMSEVWDRIYQEIVAPSEKVERDKPQRLFFDLCDPQKRSAKDILEALELIERFQSNYSVTLGLNEKECYEIAEVMNIPSEGNTRPALMDLVQRMHAHLHIDTLLVHPVRYAIASNRDEVVSFDGPFIAQPVITTGAGDHFNAGFCLGQLLDFDLTDSLACGVSTSGFYVQSGQSPSMEDLANLLTNWPS